MILRNIEELQPYVEPRLAAVRDAIGAMRRERRHAPLRPAGTELRARFLPIEVQ